METPIVGTLQTIKINRGTSQKFTAKRVAEDGTPITAKATTALFVVKPDWTDAEASITKTLDDMEFADGTYSFSLKPEDTEELPYGKYVFDLTFTDDDYRVKPAKGYLIIGNSAGWQANERGA